MSEPRRRDALDEEAIASVLNEAGERCFLCGDVRFTLVPDLQDGDFKWQVYFQNHAPWHATLTLRIVAVSSDALKLTMTLDCPSGEAGHEVKCWPVPVSCRHEVHRCLIYGDVIYDKSVFGEQDDHSLPGIPVLPLNRSLVESFVPKDYSMQAFQGRAAVFDLDFANGTCQLLLPEGAEEERLPPAIQWLLLGALLAVPVSVLFWFIWNWLHSVNPGD